jgi:hypothetical protein
LQVKVSAWVILGLAFPVLASAADLSTSRALIASLNTDLLAHDSATETLSRWCATRHLADPPTIVAHRVAGPGKLADARVRALLNAAPGEAIGYRRVALACGAHVLSNADNWYRPGRLTAAMNAELAATDHPFGAVVRSLGFHRVTLSAQVLVSRRERAIPAAILRHEALLETPDGTPFSLVVETYTREALDLGSVRQQLKP